jgi:hypothetical protein
MGQLIKMRTYPAVGNHCCAAPNADTLYTMVWPDVSSEPRILSIPDMGNRYYIVPIVALYLTVRQRTPWFPMFSVPCITLHTALNQETLY